MTRFAAADRSTRSLPVKRLRVGVLYGGRSGEHEVSLASAAAVFANLDRQRYEPIAIRIEKDGRWVLADRPPSAASAAEVIEQIAQRRARAPRRPRSASCRRVPATTRSCSSIDGRPAGDAEARGVTLTGLGLDVIFPVLHGPYGEDGTIQGLLELAERRVRRLRRARLGGRHGQGA